MPLSPAPRSRAKREPVAINPDPTPQPFYLRIRGVSRRWECCDETVERHIRAGHLSYRKVGRIVLIPMESVLAFENGGNAK
jgi:hypothetical protein